MLKAITANTAPEAEPHIYAEDDAAIYQSILGADGVFNIGSCLKATVISNNKVRIADGVAVIGGHMCRQPYAEYTDMEIANGQTGKNRNDIIVAKFVTTGTGGLDSFALTVIQGAAGATAIDPAITQDDIYAAGKIRELPLYRVYIEGLSIVRVDQLFTVTPTLPELKTQLDELNSTFVVGNIYFTSASESTVNVTFPSTLKSAPRIVLVSFEMQAWCILGHQEREMTRTGFMLDTWASAAGRTVMGRYLAIL